ncbi:MAG: hypothetical protein EOP04_18965 [Proteobacteria bacterium]|nr:MAG: hypothetical protein EOP04_18965 [Pseudomonadota bacterium]
MSNNIFKYFSFKNIFLFLGISTGTALTGVTLGISAYAIYYTWDGRSTFSAYPPGDGYTANIYRKNTDDSGENFKLSVGIYKTPSYFGRRGTVVQFMTNEEQCSHCVKIRWPSDDLMIVDYDSRLQPIDYRDKIQLDDGEVTIKLNPVASFEEWRQIYSPRERTEYAIP